MNKEIKDYLRHQYKITVIGGCEGNWECDRKMFRQKLIKGAKLIHERHLDHFVKLPYRPCEITKQYYTG